MNAFFWRNEAELMKIDHLKAAPCVTTLFLAVMRVSISIVLVLYTMIILIFTSKSNNSFRFISQWNLLVITILFTTMAIIQI